MPLPDLQPNNTDRYWLEYTFGSQPHELCFRLGSTTSTVDGQAHAAALATALKPYIGTSDSFTGLRHSAAGSNLSFPLAFTAVTGTGTNPDSDLKRAQFVALSGRSAGGYRCRITFFTNSFGTANDFRGPTTGTYAGSALYSTVTSLSPTLRAIDGQGVIWNAYVNMGYNAYWQRQLR